LPAAKREAVWDLFELHLLEEAVTLIELDGMVVRDAAEIMTQVHPTVPLRTLDALHLATFGAIEAGPLFSLDRRMVAAAKMLGFATVG
jgi:predicted nucleic acid-binding protein